MRFRLKHKILRPPRRKADPPVGLFDCERGLRMAVRGRMSKKEDHFISHTAATHTSKTIPTTIIRFLVTIGLAGALSFCL